MYAILLKKTAFEKHHTLPAMSIFFYYQRDRKKTGRRFFLNKQVEEDIEGKKQHFHQAEIIALSSCR